MCVLPCSLRSGNIFPCDDRYSWRIDSVLIWWWTFLGAFSKLLATIILMVSPCSLPSESIWLYQAIDSLAHRRYDSILNSLAPGRSECDSKNVIFTLVLLIGIFRSSHDNALDFTDKSTLFQVMAWCCQATSHYLSQCWLSSLSPYGVARPQWVKVQFLKTLFAIVDGGPTVKLLLGEYLRTLLMRSQYCLR